MLYGVVAMCFTLIYKSTQVVNFAQGEFPGAGGLICWYFIVKWQLPFVAAFAFALVFTTSSACWSGGPPAPGGRRTDHLRHHGDDRAGDIHAGRHELGLR